jgi:hypothetical protein
LKNSRALEKVTWGAAALFGIKNQPGRLPSQDIKFTIMGRASMEIIKVECRPGGLCGFTREIGVANGRNMARIADVWEIS